MSSLWFQAARVVADRLAGACRYYSAEGELCRAEVVPNQPDRARLQRPKETSKGKIWETRGIVLVANQHRLTTPAKAALYWAERAQAAAEAQTDARRSAESELDLARSLEEAAKAEAERMLQRLIRLQRGAKGAVSLASGKSGAVSAALMTDEIHPLEEP